jgi:hypothetical protein
MRQQVYIQQHFRRGNAGAVQLSAAAHQVNASLFGASALTTPAATVAGSTPAYADATSWPRTEFCAQRQRLARVSVQQQSVRGPPARTAGVLNPVV